MADETSDLVPRPDPTKLTNEAMDRATRQGEREIEHLQARIQARLDGIEKELNRLDGLTAQLPAEYREGQDRFRDEVDRRDGQNLAIIETRLDALDQARSSSFRAEREYITSIIEGLRAVMAERFDAIDGRFSESKTAVDAAFAAAKEAVSQQNTANDRAITKSEAATAEKLGSLQQVFNTTAASQDVLIADARDRLTKTEAKTAGINEAGQDQRQEKGLTQSGIMLALVAVSLVLGLAGLILGVFHH